MKRIIIALAALSFLLFPSAAPACECETQCDPCWPSSHFCKCIADCNNSAACVEDGINCVEAWNGVAYTEQSVCLQDLLPYDAVFFNSGSSCATAVCKVLMELFGFEGYKNHGQCVKDGAALFDPYAPGFFPGECGQEETFIEGCECYKENLHES